MRLGAGTDLTAAVRADVDKPLAIDPPANWQATEGGVALLQQFEQIATEVAQQRALQAQQQQQQGAAPAPATTTGKRPAAPAVKRDRNGDPIKQ